jgi:hypothetical protein
MTGTDRNGSEEPGHRCFDLQVYLDKQAASGRLLQLVVADSAVTLQIKEL